VLRDLPDGDAICHGDFHPANILLTRTGPVIIDWSTGSRGYPLGDVALTSVLFESANLPDDAPLHIRILFKFSRALLHMRYLNRYLELQPGTRREIDAWRPVMIAHGAAWHAERGL
jgi:aminoglycoside phosphotransferase (APT) family kinase protein